MKTTTFLGSVTLLSMLGSMAVANDSAMRVGDFALIDHGGNFHQMSRYQDRKAVVFMTQSQSCSSDLASTKAFSSMAAVNEFDNVEFMLLNTDFEGNREQVSLQAQERGLSFPVLMDDSQLVSETMGVQHTGEYLVYDPANFELVYRGQDANQARQFIGNLSGSDASMPTAQSEQSNGCAVNYQAAESRQHTPSYTADVAPIIAENCASCHRDGGVAPFAMDSHLMLRGWSPMMRETLMTKRMPPGQIDSYIGDFDALGLTADEMQTLVHWIDAGSPQDGDTDPLAQLNLDSGKWPLGEPDLIVKVPATEIPASGTVPYIWVDSGVTLPEDRWIKGAQLIPGDPAVVHHVVSVAVPPELDGPPIGICPNPCATGDQNPNEDGVRLQGYVPGINPTLLDDTTGIKLSADSRFVFQMHYTTSGKATIDASEFGIYFHPEDFVPQNRRVQAAALDNKFVIPANAESFETSSEFVVPVDAELMSLSPHMHVRGKNMKFTAHYPDGNIEPLLNVARYDFNWQRSYNFSQPKFVPAGTKIVVEGAFDNSQKNQHNPNPGQPVRWGDQSWEEMFIGFIGLQVSQQ